MHLTDIPPVCCSVCFQQKPDDIHIDMDAAYDGPILDSEGTRFSIDDIIICEACARAAVELLPEARAKEQEVADLLSQYDALLSYSVRLGAGIKELEKAIQMQLKPLTPQQPGRRPHGGAVKVKV